MKETYALMGVGRKPLRRRRCFGIAIAASICASSLFAGVSVAAVRPNTLHGSKSKGASAYATLLAEARASNHNVTVDFGSQPTAENQLLAANFEQYFGFPVNLVVPPGGSQTYPTEVIADAPSHSSPVSLLVNSTSVLPTLFQDGLVQKPNWTALEYKWPILGTLRNDLFIDAPVGTKHQPPSDYCLAVDQAPEGLMYSTKEYTAAELKGVTVLDLAQPRFLGKVSTLASGALIASMSVVLPGFTFADAQAYAKGLAANHPALASSYTQEALQLTTGETGITNVPTTTALPDIAAGEPLGFILARSTSKTHDVYESTVDACLSLYGAGDNLAMDELFMGWFVAKGIPSLPTSYGTFRYDPQEAKTFPEAKTLLKSAGLVSANLVAPVTVHQYNVVTTRSTLLTQELTGS